jgi:hypothetical protein
MIKKSAYVPWKLERRTLEGSEPCPSKGRFKLAANPFSADRVCRINALNRTSPIDEASALCSRG